MRAAIAPEALRVAGPLHSCRALVRSVEMSFPPSHFEAIKPGRFQGLGLSASTRRRVGPANSTSRARDPHRGAAAPAGFLQPKYRRIGEHPDCARPGRRSTRRPAFRPHGGKASASISLTLTRPSRRGFFSPDSLSGRWFCSTHPQAGRPGSPAGDWVDPRGR
jgi:hypothetical protein